MDLALVGKHLHSKDIGIRQLRTENPSLEEVFMTLTKGLVQ